MVNVVWLTSVAKGVARDVRDGALALAHLHRARGDHPGALIARDVRVRGRLDRLRLGTGVAVFGPSTLSVEDGGGLTGSALQIGEGTYVGEFANIRTAGAPIRIGRGCLLAQGVTIVGSNHGTGADRPIVEQEWHGDGVEIGDDVWLGAGVTVLPGARIGDGCVVAAHAVVRGRIEPLTIVGGVPARPLGRRSRDADEASASAPVHP